MDGDLENPAKWVEELERRNRRLREALKEARQQICAGERGFAGRVDDILRHALEGN